jgi:hypothetical protein
MRPAELTHSQVLVKIKPGAQWTLRGKEIVWQETKSPDNQPTGEWIATNLEWLDTQISAPTKTEFETAWAVALAEFENNEYQRQRQPEYPPLADLADALYWQSQGDESKMTAYLAAVDAVKEKYPKG